MSDMNRSFAGSMPEFYDRFLVPVMFEPVARDLATRLKGATPGQLLELAAGTGVVTRALTEKTTQTQFTGGDQTVTRCLYTFLTARQGDGWIVTGIREPSFDCAIGDLN
jgi:hypothetical protein